MAGHGYRSGRIDKGFPLSSSLADLLSGESFDDNHRACASGARPSTIPRGLELLGCRLLLWNGVEELAAAGDGLGAVAVREESEMSDSNKPARQNVEQKTAEKFFRGDRHFPFLVAVRIVLPAERHLAVRTGQQAMVGNGDPMRIAREVMQDVFRAAKWPFGVDDPVFAEQLAQEAVERF
jgi:hypothetical protein